MEVSKVRSLMQSCLSVVLAVVLVAGIAPPAKAFAATGLSAGTIAVQSVSNTYDAELEFSDNGVTETAAGSGYAIDGTALSIKAAGTYRISGSCANGSIAVAKSLSDVTLVLDGLALSASGTAPIVVKKSSNVTVHLADGTTNTLTDGEDPNNENSTDADVADAFEGAAVKVKSGSSATFCGAGTLVVNGNAKNGIKGAATSTVTFNEGTYDVTAANNGIAADGDVVINGGTFTVVAGNDGIKSVPDTTDTASNGKVTIKGGTFDIDAQGDGIQADAELNISAGTFDIKTLNGASSGSAFNSSTMSCKGLKASSASDDGADSSSADSTAGNLVQISGGTFKLDTADDAVHSDAYVQVTGGTFDIATGDDGMHADTSLILGTKNGLERDPDVSITKSYEGLEGGTVYVYSGRYNVVASDDGVNAAGGSNGENKADQGGGNPFNPGGGGPGGTQPGMGGGFGMRTMSADTQATGDSYVIYVYGGDLFVNCSGDGLDSNGGLYLYGGTQQVFSQSSSGADNSAIDADGTILIQGATVFTGGAKGVDGTAQSSWFGSGQKYTTSTTTYSAGKVVNATVSGSVVYSRALPKASYYTMYSAPASTALSLTTASSVTACKAGSASHVWDSGLTVDGVTTYTCSKCGAEERQTAAVGAHDDSAGSADDSSDGDSDGGSDGKSEGGSVDKSDDELTDGDNGDSSVDTISIEGAAVSDIPDQAFTGAQITYKPEVKLDGKTLSPGIDYTLSYGVNKNVGTGTVVITGTGSYTGKKTVTFNIMAKSIKSATVSTIAKKYYTGKAIKPAPKVKDGTTTLVKGADYTLSYKSNKAVGMATVTVVGKGNYTGTKAVTFKIVKRANTLVVSTPTRSVTAKALNSKKTVTSIVAKKAKGTLTYTRVAKGSSKYLAVNAKTGKVTVKKGTPKGVYKVRVRVTASGNDYYYAKTRAVVATVRVK